jgi:hypothetical protein
MENRTLLGCHAALAGVLLLLSGCGGNSSGGSALDSGTDGTQQSESSTPDTSVPDSSAPENAVNETSTPESGVPEGSSDGSTGNDGGSPEAGSCVVPEGGAPCDPGHVVCDNAPCAVPANFCCGTAGNGGFTETCETAGTSCGGLSAACDETADCAGGQICCLVATSFTSANLACQTGTSCSGGLFSIQVCRTSAECESGSGPCIPQQCTLGGGSVTIEACGNVPTCTPL